MVERKTVSTSPSGTTTTTTTVTNDESEFKRIGIDYRAYRDCRNRLRRVCMVYKQPSIWRY